MAKRVTVRDGATITSDGPFAEVKEHLAGFYLVECESADRAVEIAARVPDAVWGLVEVRPVLDMSSLDL
ncbi:MAG: YciI family protein [Pseudonocardiaceae bacterium]